MFRSDHRTDTGVPGVANRGRHGHANSFSKQLNTINDGNEIREYVGERSHDDPNQVSSIVTLLHSERNDTDNPGQRI